MEVNAPLAPEELRLLDAYWRAANYLSVGQVFLLDNPLLREPLAPEHIKPRLLGHFGTTPGLNLVYAHLNRAIKTRDLQALYVTGPGHGGPGLVANAYLEGTYSEVYPHVSMDEDGLRELFRQFSFPAGSRAMSRPRRPARSTRAASSAIRSRTRTALRSTTPSCSSRASSETARPRPGRSRRAGTRTSSSNPKTRRRGAADPSSERLQDREPDRPRADSRAGAGIAARGLRAPPHPRHGRLRRRGSAAVHQRFAGALDAALAEIAAIQTYARETGAEPRRPRWPMIVLRTPKGWTGPKEIDGLPVENSWRSHQVPMTDVRDNPEHLQSSRTGCGATSRRSSSTSTGR